jgi:hypothetical protein
MRMTDAQPQRSFPSLGFTKLMGNMAFVFFLTGGLVTTNKGISWPWFICTWGNMLVASFFSLIGYFECKNRGESISVFYAICPVLLFGALLFMWNLHDIVRALL